MRVPLLLAKRIAEIAVIGKSKAFTTKDTKEHKGSSNWQIAVGQGKTLPRINADERGSGLQLTTSSQPKRHSRSAAAVHPSYTGGSK